MFIHQAGVIATLPAKSCAMHQTRLLAMVRHPESKVPAMQIVELSFDDTWTIPAMMAGESQLCVLTTKKNLRN